MANMKKSLAVGATVTETEKDEEMTQELQVMTRGRHGGSEETQETMEDSGNIHKAKAIKSRR